MFTETTILSLVTMVVAFILGLISKKVPFISNNLIPLQNLIIGLIVAVIYWIITKDFSLAIATSGLLAGGIYDIRKIFKKIADNNNIPMDISGEDKEG